MARQVYSKATALVMTQPGEPLDVLTLKDLQVNDPGPGQILVQMLAAPINPRCVSILRCPDN